MRTSLPRFQKFLGQPPILTRPRESEELILYFAVESRAIASALVKEDESGQQPVYFISKALQGAELNYQKIEKVRLRPRTHLSTTPPILSSSHYQSSDQPAHKRHPTENKLSWKNPTEDSSDNSGDPAQNQRTSRTIQGTLDKNRKQLGQIGENEVRHIET